MMRRRISSFVAVAAVLISATPALAANHIAGDYVEARTCSVFAGACHYNGELTTSGRQALAMWHIKAGNWNGVSLAGLNALAIVRGGVNLKFPDAHRRCVLYLDSGATDAQAAALQAAIVGSYGKSLGTVIEVKRAGIIYRSSPGAYDVEARGIARVKLGAMPNMACCLQPNLVWYKPLTPLVDRRVGYVHSSTVQEPALNANWSKSCQNSAFYGHFDR